MAQLVEVETGREGDIGILRTEGYINGGEAERKTPQPHPRHE